jgi:hypothetical protein
MVMMMLMRAFRPEKPKVEEEEKIKEEEKVYIPEEVTYRVSPRAKRVILELKE